MWVKTTYPNQLDYPEEYVHKAPEAGFEPATFGLVNNVTKKSEQPESNQ